MAAAKRPAGINFEKILESMTGDVQEMRREYEESGLPINDDNQNLHHFSDRLEFLLLFGLRERSILGGRRDLWQYFCKCLADRRNIHDGLKIVKANTELKTGVGRSRCFIRYCLAHQCLGDVIQQCIDNQRVTSHFFDPGALMLDVSLSPSLLSCLYQLCDIVFDLPPTGHDLDVSWPAFARHGTSGSVWQPPSRTMSLSSLSSFTSQVSEAVLQSPSSPISPIMATVGEDEVLPTAIANSSETNALQDRLTLMQEENDSLRVSCAALQLKLDQAQQMSGTGETAERCTGEDHQLHNTMKSDENLTGSSCSQCGFLKEELKQSEDKCIELQHLQQVLETQVQTLQKRVEDFETQETEFKSRIRELENISKNPTSVSEQLVGGDSTHSLHEDTDIRIISKEIERNLGEGEGSESAHVESIGEVQGVLEEFRHKLEVLEKENQALQEQCRLAETEKATLRTNIHKVSANWFERKTRLSESDSETHHSPEGSNSRQVSPFSHTKDQETQIPEYVFEESLIVRRLEDVPKLLAELSFRTGQLDISDRMCSELKKRVKEYENVINDQEVIIHGLKDQLDTYFNDNQNMSKQLSSLTKLFEDLELTEKTRVNTVADATDTGNASFEELVTDQELKEMSNSVSKTYIKLKDLIIEKKSLVTEIERLNVLNIELQRRVLQQETRLSSVSDALHATWMVVSDMKEQHAQLHSSESFLRYELKEKRELLHRLRDELECSREQWQKIKQMNDESEVEWNNIKEELNERRRVAEQDGTSVPVTEGETVSASAIPATPEFEPPVDLLLDMAIEYGVVDADDETSTAMIAAMEGEDMHASRLLGLEEQCSYLYQKLMASTSRSLALASRLSALHQHYGSSDDDEDDDDEDDEEEYVDDDDDDDDYYNLENIDSEIMSPDPESFDTAYVSEADTGSASGLPGVLSEEEIPASGGGSTDEASSPTTDQPEVEDDLCRGLINFLPRKIEILRQDNRKLEERYNLLLDEKVRSEAQLTETLEAERKLRKQMEDQLEHLGKCVDELNLERNGKISEVEEKLKQKVASLSKREQEYESLQEDLNSLREKFEERGNLLHITNERLKEVEAALEASDEAAKDSLTRLQEALSQVTESRESHGKLSSDHNSLKKEMEMLQQETTDLRFQLSSQAMELDKAVQTEVEKCKALAKIAELEEAAITQEKDFESEREQLTSQIAELTKISSDRNRSYSGLQERMQQAETSLEAVHHELSETQSKLDVTQDTSKQLCDDNAQLREKIIQLLREKDALWQANVRLENAAGCGRAWMDNSSASNCLGCGVTFSLTRRRHHCRNCGRIFCTGCSDNWMMTAASSRRVRVCDDCFSVQAELATLVASPALQCVTGPPEDNCSGVSWEHDGSTLQRRSRTHPLPLGTQSPDDEDFSVISDDEVQNSRLSSSPSSGSPPSSGEIVVTETRATADVLTPLSLSEAPPTNAEVWVGAGTRALVPVDLPVGVALQWNFVSEPKSISFAVLHQPQLEKSPQESDAQDCAGPAQQRILIPTTRVASAKGATVKGRLLTKQPGVYTLVFDNSFSRFTAKKVTYTLRLEMAVTSQANSEAKPSTSSGVSQSSESPHLPMPMP